jgi:drug/metabolite transporter (DMT)-like permease
MKHPWIHWILFILLSFIWGSSFILMKEGMKELNAYEVASLRILSAGLILLPLLPQALKNIPSKKRNWAILSGLLGSFFPAYLFCIAETRISSSLAGMLNALTPLSTMLLGIAFFHYSLSRKQWVGILLGLAGMFLLFGNSLKWNGNDAWFALLVLIATIFYAVNVNMVNLKLKEIGSRNIATLAFSFLVIPTSLILYYAGYFQREMNTDFWYSTGASSLLGILGTAIASILFYVLLKKAGPLFSSMVTYGIPFVAIFWGVLAGESVTLIQILGLGVILAGVYIVQSK